MNELIGITFALVAAVLFSVSVFLQKKSLDKIKKFSLWTLFTNKRWLLSIALGLTGMIFYLAAVYFFRASTVQCLVAALMSIAAFRGAQTFREKIGVIKWVSLVLILIGVVVVISL